MSTVYTGDASQVTTPLTRTISGATNASPIVVTTSASHLFATNDRVVISGVGGNTAANGVWKITKVSATTFSLNGSTGNGAYTSGGTAVNHSLTPQFTIPNDGDQFDASSVNVAFEALADRTQFLALALSLSQKAWTSTTTWTSPANCGPFGILVGFGGGGAGGSGGAGSTTSNIESSGGGGGGSAILSIQIVPLVPSTGYTATIGAGGTGPSGGTGVGTAGGDGGDSKFALTSDLSNPLATFLGASGGGAGNMAANYTTPQYGFAEGGAPGRGIAAVSNVVTDSAHAIIAALVAKGGAGQTKLLGSSGGVAGGPNPQGNLGGAGVGVGSDGSGTKHGGGGGGGGAGGPRGAGAAGGAGGAGSTGTATAGSNGSAAGANTGAGGGGGGGGGAGTAGGNGGNGGNGGSGYLVLYYFGDPS